MGPNQRLLFNSFGPLMSPKCRAVVSIKLKSSIKLANCGNGRLCAAHRIVKNALMAWRNQDAFIAASFFLSTGVSGGQAL
jgi:hypothetical protein